MPVRARGIDLDTMALASVALTAEASITATGSATGDTCITTGKFTVENGGSFKVEVFTPYITKGTTNIDVELFDGATAATGTFLTSLSGHMAASVARPGAVMIAVVNLVAGTHTLTVTAFVDGGTGKFGAGDGATGDAPNARLRVTPA